MPRVYFAPVTESVGVQTSFVPEDIDTGGFDDYLVKYTNVFFESHGSRFRDLRVVTENSSYFEPEVKLKSILKNCKPKTLSQRIGKVSAEFDRKEGKPVLGPRVERPESPDCQESDQDIEWRQVRGRSKTPGPRVENRSVRKKPKKKKKSKSKQLRFVAKGAAVQKKYRHRLAPKEVVRRVSLANSRMNH